MINNDPGQVRPDNSRKKKKNNEENIRKTISTICKHNLRTKTPPKKRKGNQLLPKTKYIDKSNHFEIFFLRQRKEKQKRQYINDIRIFFFSLSNLTVRKFQK